MDTVTPIGPSRRMTGALLGAAVGLAAILVSWAVARVTGLHDHVALALIVGDGGVFSPTEGFLPVWVVPPLASGLAGWLLTRSAVEGTRWAGSAMGFVAYLIAVLLGATIVVAAVAGGAMSGPVIGSIVDLVIGWLVFAVAGSVVVAPLLAVCVAAGIGWAILVRRLTSGSAAAGTDPSPGWWLPLMIVVAIGLGILWLLWITFLQILVDSQG